MAKQRPGRSQLGGRPLVAGLIVILGIAIALVLWQSGAQTTDRASSPEQAAVEEVAAGEMAEVAEIGVAAEETSGQEATQPPEPTATPEPRQQVSDLPAVAYEDLPPGAHDTIDLIDQGGPFPYNKDGSTFQNREGILPQMEMGYYSEYTVITPGSPDRGARRIVAGEGGEMYYTDDHYSSFQEVIR